jgi:hypothetical protein
LIGEMIITGSFPTNDSELFTELRCPWRPALLLQLLVPQQTRDKFTQLKVSFT